MRSAVLGKVNPFHIVVGIFAVVAVVFLVLAVAVWTNRSGFVAEARTADGVVTGLRRAYSGKGLRPVVGYEVDGVTLELVSQTASWPAAYDVGDAVTIFYRADDPADARLGGFMSLWGLPLLFAFLGVAFAGAVGVVLFVLAALPRHGRT